MSRSEYDQLSEMRCISKECADYYWNEWEGCGWLDSQRRPIRKVEALLLNRWKSWRSNPKVRSNGVSPMMQIIALRKEVEQHPANSLSLYHKSDCTEEQKADLRARRKQLEELESKFKPALKGTT